MIELEELLNYTNNYLRVNEYKDYCPNGLQVRGRKEIEHIISGVSGSLELFEKAYELGGDVILVHHGIIWGGGLLVIDGHIKKRLKSLLKNDISLIAYHLPLDGHEEVGNSIMLCKALGAVGGFKRFGEYKGKEIGYLGELNDSISFSEFVEAGQKVLGVGEPISYRYGESKIKRVGVVTGGGQGKLLEAYKAGADVFVTGEASESTMHMAKEEGINFVSFGHYATERLGVQGLGKHLKEHFGLKHTYIDIPNKV